MRTKKVALDPIIAEVVRNALLTITEEMRSVVTRTATSILIKNAGDLSCGILDTDLELVAGARETSPYWSRRCLILSKVPLARSASRIYLPGI